MRRLISRLQHKLSPPPKAPTLNLLYERDSDFSRFYREGLFKTGTPDLAVDGYPKRFVRFYNTAQYFKASQQAEGKVIECGCWRGLSMYVFASLERAAKPEFQGEDFVIVDSFQGLAAPGAKDPQDVPGGSFACDRDVVARNLGSFPRIELVQGWVPAVLSTLPDARYRFVHIDMDHYEPIRGALTYFVPRLNPGGALVVDDYGSLQFPGAEQAVAEYAGENGLRFVGLTSGQAVFWK